jgi:A/G-specific adenine glycosylase
MPPAAIVGAVPAPNALPAPAREAILDWYAVNGRDLPFRGTSDPWAILVSEAMAQQTQAARAGEAWVRFMEAFPTAGALAAASPADVLRAWQGLGYNRRALSLWRAARQIVEVHAGTLPADLHALEALPGVGPYTARAVAAIAFGMPVGAVDTNVCRVLGRIVAGDASLDGRALQSAADDAVPPGRAGTWTHALMDLGAMLCRPRRPYCDVCPARAWCSYAASAASAATAANAASAATAANAATGIALGRSTRGGSPGHAPHAAPAAPSQAAAGTSDRRQAPSAATGIAQGRSTRGHIPGVAPNQAPGTSTALPFPATTRWLRGRIIDRLRATSGDGWTAIQGPIGDHDHAAVAAALSALDRDGLIELEASDPTNHARRARLPIS